MIADRLVTELMLVSVLVAGDDAQALAADLAASGANAEVLGTQSAEGFDLAILLAAPASVGEAPTRATVATLSGASERLLFVPTPLGGTVDAATPALPELTQWFEVFAEFGYQPVVEFDASFVSPGAFLVDRAAVAAESELSAFADRLQLGPAAPAQLEPPPVPAARLADAEAALAASRTETASLSARLSELSAQHGAAQAALLRGQAENAGWEALRGWVRAAVSEPSRDSPAALARDLPRLNAWRGAAAPVALPEPSRRRFWHPRAAPAPPILTDTALVRASRLFDAAWYVASIPELAEGAAVDPVFHYVLVGGPAGADPGPWFDTAAYLAAHCELAGTSTAPLVHAIRSGADRSMPTG